MIGFPLIAYKQQISLIKKFCLLFCLGLVRLIKKKEKYQIGQVDSEVHVLWSVII